MIANKLAGPFMYLNPISDELCEFNIKFNKDKNDFEKLIEFVHMYADKRINIECDQIDLTLMSKLQQFNQNLYLRINWYYTPLSMLSKIKEHGFKFFFSEKCPATTPTMLEDFISLGVSDVYLGDELMYSISQASAYCRKHKVRTRLVVNKISTSLWGFRSGFDCRSMFFRPEDMPLLNEYFDVFEIDCPNENFKTMKDIWFNDQTWPDDLRMIVPDLSIQVPNQSLAPTFTMNKLGCGKKCMIGKSGCTKCEQLLEISRKLADRGIGYR